MSLRERITRRVFGSQIDRMVAARVEELRSEVARHIRPTVREQVKSEIEAEYQKQAFMSGIDPDDGAWRGVQVSRRDMFPIDQDRMIEMAFRLTTQNPLGKRIRELKRDFLIGEGCTITAEEEEVQEMIDEFLNDPINNWDELQIDLVDFLGVYGELWIPTFVSQFTGLVRLGWIDPIEVFKVVPDRLNRRILRQVRMKYAPNSFDDLSAYLYDATQYVYDIINVDTNTGSKTYNYRTGNILFFKVNGAPDARRGRSDFEPLIDYIDAWDQAVFNDLERSGLLLNFIWDVTLTGFTEEKIKALKKDPDYQAPKPGSVRFHNENVKWEAVAPKLNIAESRQLSEGVRSDTLGGAGFSDFFYGVTDKTNRAGSDNLEVPILKSLTSRQRKVKAIFREIIDYQLDRKALADKGLKYRFESGKLSRKFDIKMPELSIKDLSKIGAVLNAVAAGLVVAVQQEWISNKTASTLYAAFMANFDFNFDPTQEQEQIEEEKEKAATGIYNKQILDSVTSATDALNQLPGGQAPTTTGANPAANPQEQAAATEGNAPKKEAAA